MKVSGDASQQKATNHDKTCCQGSASSKINKKRNQHKKTFDFIGNGKLKVLETTGNNSMFAVFRYNSSCNTNTTLEGVLLLKGTDMDVSSHRRKVSKQARITNNKHVVHSHSSSGQSVSLSNFSTTSSETSSSNAVPTIESNKVPSSSPTTFRTSISIRELLN